MSQEAALVIMAKAPRPGGTKTRLSPPLSPPQAANLYHALLLDTITLAAGIDHVDLALTVTPPESKDYFIPLAKSYAPAGTLLLPVGCANIGICLQNALGQIFRRGYRRAIALNSDGPSLPREYLHEALHLLEMHDLVLGPASDGGYYLIGMQRLHPDLFRDIDWSTDRVFNQTLARAADLDLRVTLTPEWYDVDTAEDLARLRADLKSLPAQRLVHTRSFLELADFGDRLP